MEFVANFLHIGREITIWLTKEGIDSIRAHDVGQSLVDAGFIYHIYFYNRFKDTDDAYYKLRVWRTI